MPDLNFQENSSNGSSNTVRRYNTVEVKCLQLFTDSKYTYIHRKQRVVCQILSFRENPAHGNRDTGEKERYCAIIKPLILDPSEKKINKVLTNAGGVPHDFLRKTIPMEAETEKVHCFTSNELLIRYRFHKTYIVFNPQAPGFKCPVQWLPAGVFSGVF